MRRVPADFLPPCSLVRCSPFFNMDGAGGRGAGPGGKVFVSTAAVEQPKTKKAKGPTTSAEDQTEAAAIRQQAAESGAGYALRVSTLASRTILKYCAG